MSTTSGNLPQPETPATVASVLAATLASPKLGALLTLAAAAALGAGLILWSLRPDYVPLGEQGSRQDALQIIEVLSASGTDYRMDPGSGLVLVPKDKLSSIRLELAAAGLSDRSDVGLEMLDQDASLGTSHFTETMRYQHALETELSRTVGSMRGIESARVHLAVPKQSVFVRDREQASASVMIRPMRGGSIGEEQVSAIVGLVSSSIPYLDATQVTVVDQYGRLLSGGDEESGQARERFQEARRLESLYAERIESLLTPMVGPGRVRAVVTAELDFSALERTEELFEPDPAQLRSEQTETRRNVLADAAGVPGALTNQPPGDGFVDPQEAPQEAPEEQPETVPTDASAIRNFELDRSITHLRQSPGSIIRLSAAVIIDDRLALADDGSVERVPLEPEQLAIFEQLAREAIGFDQARGDTVVVSNQSFEPVEEFDGPEPLPIWQQDWVWTMVRQSLVGLAVLLLVMLVVRPAVRRLGVLNRPEPPAESNAQLGAPANEDGADSDKTAGDEDGKSDKADGSLLPDPPVVYGDILNMARAMAAEDPKRVARVVKDWVGES